MKKIAVILAAFNGEKWIVEQLDTILAQENVEITVFVSIDLSIDKTLNICTNYAKMHNNVHVLSYGEKFGAAAPNFFRLIRDVDDAGFDFFAFADQDDFWLPEKIFRAVNKLNEYGADCYASDLTLWENGEVRGELKKSQKLKDFDYIFQGASAGCTYVLNKDSFLHLKKIISKIKPYNKELSHDWITYAATRSKGFKWFIDPSSFILYRQHSSNVQGARKGIRGGLKKISQIRSGWYFSNILKLQDFLQMNESEQRIFSNISAKSIVSRLNLIFNAFNFRRKFSDAVVLMIIFAIY